MERRLYFALNLAQQAIRSRVDAEGLALTGLTSAQMGVLFYVAKHDGCLLKELGQGMGLKNAAITGLVARTEKTGCLRRRASSEDGRATHLHLTAKGKKKLEDIARLNEELNRSLRAGFSEQEIEVVLRFLGHVIELGTARAST